MRYFICLLVLLVPNVSFAETDEEIIKLINKLDDGWYSRREVSEYQLAVLMDTNVAKLVKQHGLAHESASVREVSNKLLDYWYDVPTYSTTLPHIKFLPGKLRNVDGKDIAKEYYDQSAKDYNELREKHKRYDIPSAKPNIEDDSGDAGIIATRRYIRDRVDEGIDRKEIGRVVDIMHLQQSRDYFSASDDGASFGILTVGIIELLKGVKWQKQK